MKERWIVDLERNSIHSLYLQLAVYHSKTKKQTGVDSLRPVINVLAPKSEPNYELEILIVCYYLSAFVFFKDKTENVTFETFSLTLISLYVFTMSAVTLFKTYG